MTRPLQLGVIGVGRMGSFHVRVLESVAEVEVVTVVDSNAEAASTLAKTIDARSMTSLEEAVAHGGLDAVLIATPTPSHPRLVEIALRAGLHVLCEKPLSLDASPDARLADLAASRGRVLQIGFWRRFSPPWVEARRLIDAGAIGEPLTIRLAQWDANPPPAEFCDPEVSGGLAIDCGVHEYDLAEWLTGLGIRSVTARNLPVVDRALAAVGDVDNLVALLDLEGGVVATVDLTRNARYDDDVRTEILGAAGAIFVDLLPTGRARLADATGVTEVSGSQVPDATAAGVAGQAKAFAAAVRGEAVDLPSAEASRRAVSVGRAVQRAAASGERVNVWADGAAQD